jgi:glycerophosphoryl diester phosphodiesterase
MTAHRSLSVGHRRLSRRSLLAGALGVAGAGLLPACSEEPPAVLAAPQTVASLTADVPFYVAHRGGGDNWPEMTAYAYEQASALPWVKALEISVRKTSDGVLACIHDENTSRLSEVAYTVAEQPWSVLQTLKVRPTWTVDPTQPARPYARIEEIVERHADRLVLFVEPKVDEAVDDLLKIMSSLNQPERVVWKQPINRPFFARAKEAGFSTWGYVLNESAHLNNLDQLAASPHIDMLGAPRYENEDFGRNVATAAERNGKKTIMWPIRSADDRTRALSLGCTGMMTSNILQVPPTPL